MKARLMESRLVYASIAGRLIQSNLPLSWAPASAYIESKTPNIRFIGWYPSLKYWKAICKLRTNSVDALQVGLYESAPSAKIILMLAKLPAWQIELTFSLLNTIQTAHCSLGDSPAVLMVPEVRKQLQAKLVGVQVETQLRMRSTWPCRQLSIATFRDMMTSPLETRSIRQSVLESFLSSTRTLSRPGAKAAEGPTGGRLTLSVKVAHGRMQNILDYQYRYLLYLT